MTKRHFVTTLRRLVQSIPARFRSDSRRPSAGSTVLARTARTTSTDKDRSITSLLPPGDERTDVLSVRELSKSYRGRPIAALSKFSLEVQNGEFVCLLGPSGSGKTTLLKILAGFLYPDEGEVISSGENITRRPPQQRNFGVVFQNYALFPHMTAYDNVAFPLRARHYPAAQLRDRVQWALELVQLIAESHMRPTDLSGGQQQRVAIARAIVFEPSLLLLDEPLSSLDRRLRQNLQLEIRQLQRKLGIAAVYVTHDQEEAMTLADRIVVLHDGRLDAVGTPSDLYQRPPTLFTANFLGDANSFQCSVSSNNVDALQVNVLGATMQAIWGGSGPPPRIGQEATIVVRPESAAISLANGHLACSLVDSLYVSGKYRLWLKEVKSGKILLVDQGEPPPAIGSTVRVGWPRESGTLLTM